MEEISPEQMTKLPHKLIGALTYNSLQNQVQGSGILISPDLVLTCAHNLYDKSTGVLCRNFKFYPGLSK